MLRSAALPFAAIFLFAGPLAAQPQTRGETPRDSISRALRVLREELGVATLAAADSFRNGNQTIPAGRTEQATLGVYGGTLTVRGHLTGSAVVVNGDLIVADGGRIDGDAIAVRGRVVREGGSIGGSTFTVGGDLRLAGLGVPARTAIEQMRHELGIALTTLAIVIALGIGVLMFAGGHLTGTAETLASHPGKSFFVGVMSEMAILPTLVLLIIALALTVIGVLLIPFAIVAYFLATLGVGALGLLACAQVMGTALGGSAAHDLPERRRNLRALLLGTVLIGSIWVLAALVTSVPVVGGAVRGFAFVMTWVAITAGFGAAIISRVGQRKRGTDPTADDSEQDISWQTPTPVTGVAAARRPASASGAGATK